MQVWRTLRKYFPYTRPFPRGESRPCAACLEARGAEERKIEERKELAQEQRALLYDMLNERNRPTWAKASQNTVYLIPRQ